MDKLDPWVGDKLCFIVILFSLRTPKRFCTDLVSAHIKGRPEIDVKCC